MRGDDICLWTCTCCCRPAQSAENSVLDILDSPPSESKPFIAASSNQRVISLSCLAWLNSLHVFFPHYTFTWSQVSIRSTSVCHVPLFLHASPSFSLCLYFFLTFAACCSYQDTELFEIIEKLQVSNGNIDLMNACVAPERHKLLIIITLLVHQGSRIDEQRCEFPLPLKVSI